MWVYSSLHSTRPLGKLALITWKCEVHSGFRRNVAFEIKPKKTAKVVKLSQKKKMGAVKNNWNAMEVAEQAPDISTSSQIQIRYSSQSVDPSLPLPQITPLVKYVSLSLSPSLYVFW